MLPFTKRPGRGDESADAVGKDDASHGPAAAGSAMASAPLAPSRPPLPSVSDEEMTTLMPVKSLGTAVPAPRPAAGVPAVRPSTRSLGSSPPGALGSRTSGRKFATDDEDEDGRTVVRGAPKIVKRGGAKSGLGGVATTVSPSAVIKATLDSARASTPPPRRGGEHLMAPPPSELLEDFSDLRPKRDEEHTALLLSSASNSVPALGQVTSPSVMPGQMAPQALQPQPIPTGSYASAYPPPPNPYAPASSSSTNVPGAMAMPAHFMVPQAPYSDGRMDPPGTAVTSRTRIGARPAMSWAAALLAFGLFVGVGAVAIMQGNNESVAETGASFVDPSHAPGAARAAAQPAAQAAQGGPGAEEPKVAVPPVAVPPVAMPAAAPTMVAAAVPAVTAEPEPKAEPKPEAKAEPVVAAAPKPVAKPEPKPVAVAQPVSRPAPAPRPAAPRSAAASDDEKPAKPVAKAAGKGAAKGGSDVDEETKKALEALQKSQLESSF